jgi:hypothetical protein
MNTFQPRQHPGSPAPAQSLGGAVYRRPDDVTRDPTLTTAEKRAVLASWISGARAIENAPALRQIDSGAVVQVDAILQALASLDERTPRRGDDRKRRAPPGRTRSAISRWFSRVGLPKGANDDDDDPPPPAPAGFGLPYRPTFVAAHKARPERPPVLAYAAG